ncbi:MAG: alpha/beta hydrolase-fold protein [Jatrophihabitantaceae bacterium]
MSTGRPISRRAALLGSLAAAGGGCLAFEEGLLPGRHRLNSALGLGGADSGLPAVPAGKKVSGRFVSARRLGRGCGYTIAYPNGAAERIPVAVVLHARAVDHRAAFSQLGLDRFLTAGGHRFAVASVDGGDTYWHRRASGEDAGAMVIEEFLPILRAHGLDTRRLALLGWSMGGYGALWLAGVLGAAKVAATAALSPALWHRPGQTAPGAFDDPADFAAHDVFSHAPALAGIPVRVDCGTEDGFCPAARDYVRLLRSDPGPAPAGEFTPGGHAVAYWRRAVPGQLAFLAEQLG